MKKLLFTAIATCAMLPATTYAQLDLGGAIGAGVNQAAAATQGAGSLGSGINAGLNAGGAVNQAAGAAQGAGALNSGFNAGTQFGSQLGSQLGSQIGGSTGSQFGAQVGSAFGSQVGAQAGTQLGSQLGAPTLGTQASGQFGAQTGTSQGWLGGLSNDFRSSLQPSAGGTMVFQDNLNPALQQYGFRPGDQIIGMNGQPLQAGQVDTYLQQNPGQVRVLRNGQTIVLDTNRQMSGMAHAGMAQGSMQAGFASGRPRLGITMNPSQNAVIVASVAQGSPAQLAGIRPGDQILSVNGRPVANPNAMIQAVGQASANESLALQLRRNGQVIQSQVMLSESGAGQYRAGYGQPGQGMAQGDLNSRIDQLERMLQDLRNEVRQLGPAGAQGSVGAAGGFGTTGSAGASDSFGASSSNSLSGEAALGTNDAGRDRAGDNNRSGDNRSNDNQSSDNQSGNPSNSDRTGNSQSSDSAKP